MKSITGLGAIAFSRNILASMAIMGSAAGIAGLGTFASFTSSATASHTASTGVVSIAVGTVDTVANRLNLNSPLLTPGLSYQRAFNLTNTGTLDLATLVMTTSATTSSLLDTDVTNGLQLVVDRCSVPWTESGTTPNFTYACSGTLTTTVTSKAFVGASPSSTLTGLNASTAAGTDYLRATVTLPTTADNTFQNKSSTLRFSFVGTR